MVAQHLLPCTQAEAQGLGWEVAGSSPQTPTGRDQGPDSPSSWETCAPDSGELDLCSQALEGQSLCTPLEKTVEEAAPGGDGDRWGLKGGLQEGLTCRDNEQGRGPLSFMSLCLAQSEEEDDSFSSWNIYRVPGPKPSTLHAFSHLIITL